MRLGPSIFQPEPLPQSFQRATKALGGRNAVQEAQLRPNLTRLLHFVQLSLLGEVDKDITFKFAFRLTPKEKAEVDKLEAETDQIRIDSSVLDPGEVRKRVANSPDTPYQVIDPAIFA
jgi:hypothetical protein